MSAMTMFYPVKDSGAIEGQGRTADRSDSRGQRRDLLARRDRSEPSEMTRRYTVGNRQKPCAWI